MNDQAAHQMRSSGKKDRQIQVVRPLSLFNLLLKKVYLRYSNLAAQLILLT